MIADYEKTPRPRWAGAILLLAVLACVVLTNAYVSKADFLFGEITNLGQPVNSSYGDVTPSISEDGLSLYFASDRPGGFGSGDIWVSTRATKDDDWGQPVNLGPVVNTSANEACPSISSDGLSLFFSDVRFFESNPLRSGGYGNGDLWVTTRATKDDNWSTAVNLGPYINTASYDISPHISPDGLSLFFSSDRAGGTGGLDLWVAKRVTKDDNWGTPVNLGQPVNSSDSEDGPSISSDGLTFFFASSRNGYYNIWMTKRANGSTLWEPPLILQAPINSGGYEWAPEISSDGSTLYFCASRSGGQGYYDIWQVSILPIVDFNGDGNIDTDDLLILIDNWGQNEPLCDIGPTPYGDDIVDIKDLEVFMSYWEKENMPVSPEEEP